MLSKRADVAYVRETQIRRNEDYGDYAQRLKDKQSASEDVVGPAELDLSILDESSLASEEETPLEQEE